MKQISNDELESLSESEIVHTALGNDQQTTHSDDLIDMATDSSTNMDHEEVSLPQSTQNISIAQSDQNAEYGGTSILNTLTKTVTETAIEKNTIERLQATEEQVITQRCLKDSQKVKDNGDFEAQKNTHIFYQGNWYHINQFVSWEQGKYYMPKQSRLTRFFSNYVVFDKFISSENEASQSLVRHDTVIASWQNGKYVFGLVKRIIKHSIRGKSAYPVFKWDKTCTSDIDIASQELLPINNNLSNGLCKQLHLSKHFRWTTGKEFVTCVEGEFFEDTFTVGDDCLSKMQKGMI